jgi:hypothetical protein
MLKGTICGVLIFDILKVNRRAMSKVMSRTSDAQLRKIASDEDREGVDTARR